MRLVPVHELEKLAKRKKEKWTAKDYGTAALATAIGIGGGYVGLGKRGRAMLAASLRPHSTIPLPNRRAYRDFARQMAEEGRDVSRVRVSSRPMRPSVIDMEFVGDGAYAPKIKKSAASWSILGAALVDRRQG